MMTIKQISVTVGEITKGYVNNDDQGIRGYDGLLDIRPPYQREFIYNDKEQQAVINTVLHAYPLNVMYWVKRSNDADCPYEVMDGQQRTLSLCEYVSGVFAVDFKYFSNQPEDIRYLTMNLLYMCVRAKSLRNWSGSKPSILQVNHLTSRRYATQSMQVRL